MDINKLREQYNAAVEELETRSEAWDNLADDATDEQVDEARTALTEATEVCDKAEARVKESEAIVAARGKHKPVALDKDDAKKLDVRVTEPDMYEPRGKHQFLRDLYMSQLRNDHAASERIGKHQEYSLANMPEERAVATGTLGGIIPPTYLIGMYAKASRNGRVFADQVSHSQPLPETGMSVIIPRLTTGTAAGVQTSENTTVTTQDPVETDLTVPVRTIAGYVPVSRQTLERASYSEGILFEDLLARYWSTLDSQCLTGTGNSGQMLGVFNTVGVVSISANSDGTVTKLWNTLASAQSQILTKWGGLGLKPDKIFMHPRRWQAITAYLDDNKRPLFGYNNVPAFNIAGQGEQNYGFVGNLAGLPVYVDSNMPINLDTATNRDAIVVTCSNVVHVMERNDDPVTLAFEQQAGTSLQVQLIAYGYAAFTAGRYPDATAVIDDFPAPTF